MAKRPTGKAPKNIEAIRHSDDRRVNIPTAEHQSVIPAEHLAPRALRYPRNTDLDPQLVWRGKDDQDWSDLAGKGNAPIPTVSRRLSSLRDF